jgi:hypothetical protein
MPLYKFLPFESVEVITSKLQSFILDINEIKTSTYKISIENLLTNVPELAQQLEQYNFGEMSVARILVTAPKYYSKVCCVKLAFIALCEYLYALVHS